MSRRLYKQFATGLGVIAGPEGIVFDFGATAPTEGSSGYAPGAMFVDTDASVGAQVLINEGSATSCSFKNLSGQGNGVVAHTSGNLTLSATLHAGKTVNLSVAGGSNVTMPAATGSGNRYTIYIGANLTSANYNITRGAGSTDVFQGIALMGQNGTAANTTTINANNTGNIVLSGSTKGGIRGDRIFLTDVASGVWLVDANLQTVGTPASPFAA